MKRNNLLAVAALLSMIGGSACQTLPQKLIWENDEVGPTGAAAAVQKENEVTPAGLINEPVNPITAEEARRTVLSRPKAVKVEDLRGQGKGGNKYYDVVDQRAEQTLAPVIDQAARPYRITTFDNNAVAKDYTLRFGSAWERTLEAVLEIPLNTIDRSSGIVTTEWVYDENPADKAMSMNPFGDTRRVRYKYTVRVMDKGNGTQIKVVPFAQTLSTGGWRDAKPSLLITEEMFQRIERELIVPVPSER
jgi:hypothetical protein